MNFAKLQLEALKNILSRNSTVRFAEVGDGRIAITPDAYTVFFIPESDLCIDKSKITELPTLGKFGVLPESAIRGKVDMCIYKVSVRTPYIVRIYEEEHPENYVFCDKRFYDKYDSSHYTPYFEKNAIYFVEELTGLVHHVILPVRSNTKVWGVSNG